MHSCTSGLEETQVKKVGALSSTEDFSQGNQLKAYTQKSTLFYCLPPGQLWLLSLHRWYIHDIRATTCTYLSNTQADCIFIVILTQWLMLGSPAVFSPIKAQFSKLLVHKACIFNQILKAHALFGQTHISSILAFQFCSLEMWKKVSPHAPMPAQHLEVNLSVSKSSKILLQFIHWHTGLQALSRRTWYLQLYQLFTFSYTKSL